MLMARAGLFRLAAALALLPAMARADAFSASADHGYGRLLFTLDPPAHATATVDGAVLAIAFDRKVSFDPVALAQSLPLYFASARADSDGRTYRFALAGPVRAHTSAAGDKIAVDLAPPGFAGEPPELSEPPPRTTQSVDPSKLEVLAVRTGAYQNFTRVVFDWNRNVSYSVVPGAGRLTVRFGALARPDFSAFARQSPPWVKNAAWRVDGKSIVVDFQIDADSGYHDFRDGSRVVLDVLAPKTDAEAYDPPGGAKAKPTLLASAANRPLEEVKAAAAELSADTQPPAPDSAGAAAPAASPSTSQPVEANLPQAAAMTAQGKLTREGVVLTFAGASRKPAAVFLRGMTAWIVLQDAPAFDGARLKAELADFPSQIDASSGSGVSVLRIGLKEPEQIAAFADGSNLKVVIAPHTQSSAIAMGFARNQAEDGRAFLTTLLPGAMRAVEIADPEAGDRLLLAPADVGRALIKTRSFADFQALETACGLAILPFSDDLSLSAAASRVTISRAEGLALSAPSMRAGDAQSAVAGPRDASFLDFAKWGDRGGSSFLAVERRLRAAIVRAKRPDKIQQARLALARFYLASGFAAETLGLLDQIQATDPTLESDRRFQTMRAAADYEMGRYRDARNAIAASAFDQDRHAALWRGLIAAAMEDWNEAGVEIDRAGPVLRAYPREWRARARLAAAAAALGRGRLEIADAALTTIPSGLSAPVELEAQLDRARLYASEGRDEEANRLFSAVERGGDERQATWSIYYRVNAALRAGTMTRPAAIAELERLRFRWRGDGLELDTLRKLGGLYFDQRQWRNGLRVLRIAADNFPDDDRARQARDDMRAAFVNLFLRGAADKVSPIEALALFYDNLDLTPIGAQGDEMIRRMADRLVAVDLLGPAADLLKYQIDKRLDGVARAQVAARLAAIYLMDKKPDLALEELRQTAVAGLPDPVMHARMLLDARALAGLKRWQDALDLIALDQAPDTTRLRADIYWESGDWALAGGEAERALGDCWSGARPLSEEERQQAMRAAVAYSLANDEAGLDRLRDHFAQKMAQSPDANAFKVLSGRIDSHGVAFRSAAAQVASIDTLRGLMKDIREQTQVAQSN
ncbi:MAG TPA: hypothetical protein VHC42_03290 [Rhizomicrobium sp.]|nr:hypothetical protein [Rhizomicrobium sp.]